MTESDETGKILRGDLNGFTAGCHSEKIPSPGLGMMAKAQLSENVWAFGILTNIRIYDNEVIQALARNSLINPAAVQDQRINRLVPIELEFIAVGYQAGQTILHQLPSRPPSTLEIVYACTDEEIVAFTSTEDLDHFAYLLNATSVPRADLLVAHIVLVHQAHRRLGQSSFLGRALQVLRRALSSSPDEFLMTSSRLSQITTNYYEK